MQEPSTATLVELDHLIALTKKVELLQQMAEELVRTSPYTQPQAKEPAAVPLKKEESTMSFDIDQITTENMKDRAQAAAAGAAIRAALGHSEPGKKPKVAAFDIDKITVQEMRDPAKVQHAASAILQALRPDEYRG